MEAAKEFAVQQEQTFVKKIDNLKLKLASKNEEIQEMDSVINQQRHALKTAQQEKVSAVVSIFFFSCILVRARTQFYFVRVHYLLI